MKAGKLKFCILFSMLALLTACGLEDTSSLSEDPDLTLHLVSEKIEAPREDAVPDGKADPGKQAPFEMGENLKAALTQLAISYDDYDESSVMEDQWMEFFVSHYIQNSRLTFDYLDQVSEENDGMISVEEVEYMNRSLTNVALNFDSFVDKSLDRYDAASMLYFGKMTDYSYEYVEGGVIVNASLQILYDGSESILKKEITAELVTNPDSCFDGYSVKSVHIRN